ncbi:MAG: PAS domain-containing sensor histidine kinase [Caldisericia bacterium]|nr:PAS domain-containing sensor histidine kinase [Caldisericia bacterium]
MSKVIVKKEKKPVDHEIFYNPGLFQVFAENSQFGMVIFDKKHFIYANPYFISSLEYSPEEIIQIPIINIVHKDYQEIIMRKLHDLFSGREIAPHYEIKVYTKSRKILWLDIFTSSYRLDNKIVGFATTFDITVKQNAFEQIKLLMDRWENTFNSVNDMIFIVDREFKIIMANKTFKESFGDDQATVISQKCYQLVNHSDVPCNPCVAMESLKDKKVHIKEWTDNRTNHTYLFSISPVLDENGNMISFVHIAKDISNLKKLERNLINSLNVQTKLLSIVSHELRTPLTAIKGGVDLLKNTLLASIDDDQRNLLDIILRNIERLHNYINDVLDYEKLRSGQVKLKRSKNNLNTILKEAHTLMKPAATEKGISLGLDLDPNLPIMEFDKDKVIQVITNLLNNAIKFTSTGRIDISSSFNSNYAEVTISDTGIGIKTNELPFIFQSFVQFGEPEQQNKGSGLGLSICKEIIEKHGGKIWAESEFGEGSAFHFTLLASLPE